MNIFRKLWRNKSTTGRSIPGQSAKESEIENIFDNLARSMAGSLTRRQALKLAITGFSGMALTKFGINTAWAGTTCLCNGVTKYDPNVSCCTLTGVAQKSPIVDLSNCPGKVPNPTFTCSRNGCGSSVGTPPYGNWLGISLNSSCDDLNCCFATCNYDAGDCLEKFLQSLLSLCSGYLPVATIPSSSPVGLALGSMCIAHMTAYRSLTGNEAPAVYERLQKLSCHCCGTHTCSDCMPGTFPCIGLNDRSLNCCSVGYSCWVGAAGLSKCCPLGTTGYADSSGIVQCCPSGTYGNNDSKGGFSCKTK